MNTYSKYKDSGKEWIGEIPEHWERRKLSSIAKRITEYVLENVFNVIDRRYRTGKPLIITTNLHLKMITEEQSVDKRRIYDRILELCTPVCVDGASKRAKVSKEKMNQLKEMSKEYKEGEFANE